VSYRRKFPFDKNLKGKEKKETFHPYSKINADISIRRKELFKITITKEQTLQ
jgi:hypothetical protein